MTTINTGVNGGTFPNTIVGPAAGEVITAASINNGLQGAANECKYLYDTKAALAGATFTGLVTCQAGLTIDGSQLSIPSGANQLVDAGADITVNGDLIVDTDGVFAPTLQIKAGTVSYPDPQRKGDADHTLSVGSGQYVILSTAPTTNRTVTLNAPSRNGQWFEFSLHASGNNPTTKYYEIKRSGSSDYIVRLTGWSKDQATDLGSGVVRIHAEGNVWRLTGGVGIELGADA